ncbi:MAG: hypothetical protein DRP86_06745 [Candidatus Neomarinimicrobiota bacterium]|nr:GAF domain-containing protein [Candidatus Neomarinimicrobiota bacterium]RKY48237.1 MAG: hypothetical protein DRP86_06745 [Candidatus Neomarinimicrobiota bacterium]
MFEFSEISAENREYFYQELYHYAETMMSGETDIIALTANMSSLIWHTLPDINWVGFYFFKKGELVLGPFQGKPACVRIAPGQGVCGMAFSSRKTLRVDDVHTFPGHIACDPESHSEIVIPVLNNNDVIAVLDIDSPLMSRFTQADQIGLEKIVRLLEKNISYSSLS